MMIFGAKGKDYVLNHFLPNNISVNVMEKPGDKIFFLKRSYLRVSDGLVVMPGSHCAPCHMQFHMQSLFVKGWIGLNPLRIQHACLRARLEKTLFVEKWTPTLSVIADIRLPAKALARPTTFSSMVWEWAIGPMVSMLLLQGQSTAKHWLSSAAVEAGQVRCTSQGGSSMSHQVAERKEFLNDQLVLVPASDGSGMGKPSTYEKVHRSLRSKTKCPGSPLKKVPETRATLYVVCWDCGCCWGWNYLGHSEVHAAAENNCHSCPVWRSGPRNHISSYIVNRLPAIFSEMALVATHVAALLCRFAPFSFALEIHWLAFWPPFNSVNLHCNCFLTIVMTWRNTIPFISVAPYPSARLFLEHGCVSCQLLTPGPNEFSITRGWSEEGLPTWGWRPV